MYRRSYLLWPPVMVIHTRYQVGIGTLVGEETTNKYNALPAPAFFPFFFSHPILMSWPIFFLFPSC